MAEIEKVAKGARNVIKRAKPADALQKPVGLAIAGAALAAVPFAAEKLTGTAKPKVAEKASELTEGAKSLLGGHDDDESGRAAPGFGSGRRMPIQQSVDVAVPVKLAYNHWTRVEDWPEFMHRIESAEQADETTVSLQAKIWGISKRFEAEIVEQRPDERIEWNVTDGYAHTGVVTFHPLSKNLTRVDVSLDVQPANLIDKASRGMRFVKRAVRADLHRFKAYAELAEDEPKGWRGTIEDGKVKRRSSGGRSRNGSDPKRSRAGSRS
jgi:uncharacterized membrane protein